MENQEQVIPRFAGKMTPVFYLLLTLAGSLFLYCTEVEKIADPAEAFLSLILTFIISAFYVQPVAFLGFGGWTCFWRAVKASLPALGFVDLALLLACLLAVGIPEVLSGGTLTPVLLVALKANLWAIGLGNLLGLIIGCWSKC
jgi:hypothetical protein